MQHASAMPSMSPAEDLFRRLDEKRFVPRDGQAAMIDYVSNHREQTIYTAELPTGYGKSKTALCSADVMKQQGRINRVLIVVPTSVQKEQYINGIRSDIVELGLNLNPDNIQDVNGEIKSLRANKLNEADIYVATVQGICADKNGFYNDLLSNGRWLIFCDEYHHLRVNEENNSSAWSEAIEKLNYSVLLGLTATPKRTDGKKTIFDDYAPAVRVTFEEAYEEKAVRGVRAHIEHYFVDILTEDGIDRLTTENIDNYDLSKEMRFTSKYIAGIMSSAHDCLTNKSMMPGQSEQHQMLIFAMSVEHAHFVSKILNAMYGHEFSDWVGVGEHGRKDHENKAVVKQYRDGKIKCLVQVNIAGEGFDHPKSSVLVFLNLSSKDSVQSIQQAGRGVRRNYGITEFKDDVCDMFASPDTPIAELIKEFADRTLGYDEDDEQPFEGQKQDCDRKPTFYDIPPLATTIEAIEYDRSEIVAKIKPGELEWFRSEVRSAEGNKGDYISDERLLNILATAKINQMESAAKGFDTEAEMRSKTNKAVTVLVGNICRMKAGGSSFASSMFGDISRQVNTFWIRKSGLKVEAMLKADLEQKYNWVKQVSDDIKATGKLPTWLNL